MRVAAKVSGRPRQPEGKQVRGHDPGENARHLPVELRKVTGKGTRAFPGLNDEIRPEDGKEWIAGFKVIRLVADLHCQSGKPRGSAHQRRGQASQVTPPVPEAPVHLQATGSGQVRDGPGPGFAVSFAVKAGMPLMGRSYLGNWVRVSAGSGREGWIPLSHLVRRTEPAH